MQDRACLSKAVCLVHVRINAFCAGFEPHIDIVSKAQAVSINHINMTTLVGW